MPDGLPVIMDQDFLWQCPDLFSHITAALFFSFCMFCVFARKKSQP
jgi:hypothetical protein